MMSCQLHVPAALIQGKSIRLDGVQSQSERGGKKKIPLSIFTLLTELTQLRKVVMFIIYDYCADPFSRSLETFLL